MKRAFFLLTLLTLNLSAAANLAQAAWFDRSHGIFFPPGMRDQISAHFTYPVFWWNFAIIDVESIEKNTEELNTLCAKLKENMPQLIRRVECNQELSEQKKWIEDWARDYFLRNPWPGASEIQKRMELALAKASLPAGDAAFLHILRNDPLESWKDLKTLAENKIRLKLDRVSGFFYDANSNRVVIPIQMGFSPHETQQTKKIWDALRGSRTTLIGPHSSSLTNEEQITEDVGRVSLVGTLVLIAFGLGLALSGRWRLLFLFPPVLLATAVAVGATIAIFGNVHGLTLSFGVGIIGLAMDYGLHGALNTRSSTVWKSNLYGLLTTSVGLFVLMWSSIPLMRQMMIFSIVGLSVAYVLYYFLLNRYPDFFSARPFAMDLPSGIPSTALVLFLIAASIWGFATIRPSLEMKDFDYQDSRTQVASQWFFKSLSMRSPLFQVHSEQDILTQAHQELDFSRQTGIAVENVATYLPRPAAISAYAKSWNENCMTFLSGLSAMQKAFFKPFLESNPCPASTEGLLSSQRSYFKHLQSNGKWISIWLPKNDDQEIKLRTRYPDSVSLRDIASIFPKTLSQELKWMSLLSLALAVLLLVYYYRSATWTFLSLVPFLAGTGMIALSSVAMNVQISFVSIVGLLMVFGFSFDYGIFVTDLMRNRAGDSRQGVLGALTLASLTNIVGFLPLLFCKHPVLFQLGHALFFGAIGTYIGSVWGIPGLAAMTPQLAGLRDAKTA